MTYMYYIQYKEQKNVRWYKRLFNKLIFSFRIVNVDSNKKTITINKKYINKKAYKKIQKYIKKNNMPQLTDNILVAKNIYVKFKGLSVYEPQVKKLMKYMLPKIINKIEKSIGKNFKTEFVYVLMNNDKEKNLLYTLEEYFKGINIVTTSIGKMRRMEKTMVNDGCTLSVTNNHAKALKRAKIVININFNNQMLKEFIINRNCIVINLNDCNLYFKNNFQGCVVNSIEIDFINKYTKYVNVDDFNKIEIYSSYVNVMNKNDILKNIEIDKCTIKHLVGNSGIITEKELRNNFTNNTIKLDKIGKKD